METPIPTLLLVLGGKCLLNWAVVLAQRGPMVRSFLGTFCVSLAATDLLLSLAVSAIFFLGDLSVLGLRLTRYHICLLAQVACFTYGQLHWPVFLLGGLDFAWTLSPRPVRLGWARRLAYPSGVCAVWASALLWVFSGSGFDPYIEGGPHLLLRQCRVFPSPQSTQVGVVLLLAVGVALLCCCLEFLPCRNSGIAMGGGGGASVTRCCQNATRHCLYRTLADFLSTWYAFVILLVALLLLRVETPAFLDMNVPWLCFLNSFLIGAICWWRSPTFQWERDPVFPDGFCRWHFLRSVSADINGRKTESSRSSHRNRIH
ncbi:probable G-protein coupled receptor 160 [Megalops cyprinoides]|uniref:probable G-protein coupled receptor 160 n=1 Tax=Megalops cyprinoides TaxID=118141 RepID=UPI001864DBE7|nr:probable G-protein coupled receptor 160 [Megalops cyprinoides]